MPLWLGQGQYDLLAHLVRRSVVGIGLTAEESCFYSKQDKEISSTFNIKQVKGNFPLSTT